jgi:hypothetical protein
LFNTCSYRPVIFADSNQIRLKTKTTGRYCLLLIQIVADLSK